MPGNPNFWTPQSSLEFHATVTQLYRKNQQPGAHHIYPNIKPKNADTGRHVLSVEDELQLADDIAFLAQTKRDPLTISAVTVQERSTGLHFLISSNAQPVGSTQAGLQRFTSTLTKYAKKGACSRPQVEKGFSDAGVDFFLSSRHWTRRVSGSIATTRHQAMQGKNTGSHPGNMAAGDISGRQRSQTLV